MFIIIKRFCGWKYNFEEGIVGILVGGNRNKERLRERERENIDIN